jgi:hypothetical protein
MITLECGDQRWTVTDEMAESILKIQKVMKATHWKVSQSKGKDGTDNRADKRTGKRPASQKRD